MILVKVTFVYTQQRIYMSDLDMGNTNKFVILCVTYKFIIIDHLSPKAESKNLCNNLINVLAFSSARNSLM